jgi:membrane-associated phospholipid phosphatase
VRSHARRRLTLELGAAYLAAWLVGVGFGFVLEHTNTWHEGAEWERVMLRWLNAHPLPYWLDQVMLAMPLLGTNLTILPLMLAVGWWLWKMHRRPSLAAQLLVVCIGSLSLNPTMKYLLGRERPALFPLRGMYNWASYPSGHLILTTALYFTIALLLLRSRGWWWPLLVAPAIVLTTAYSRLYLAVHWPTDVVGGLLIGVTWLVGTWTAFRRYRAGTALDTVGGEPLSFAPAEARAEG